MSFVPDGWKRMTWRHWAWTLAAVVAFNALLFLSDSLRLFKPPPMWLRMNNWGLDVLFAAVQLLAFLAVDRIDKPTPARRYAYAILVASAICGLLDMVLSYWSWAYTSAPIRFYRGFLGSLPWAVLVVLVALSVRKSLRVAEELQHAQVDGAAEAAHTAGERVQSLESRFDASRLVASIEATVRAYGRDRGEGDAMLDELSARLRVAAAKPV